MQLRIVLSFFVTFSIVLAQTSPPLSAATPLDSDYLCPTSQTDCASIGEPNWCCPSGSRCAFRQGGSVTCCDYSIPCAEEEGQGPPENTPEPSTSTYSPTTITQITGTVETVVVEPNGGTITIDPTTNVVSTIINDIGASSRCRRSKARSMSNCAGMLLAVGFLL